MDSHGAGGGLEPPALWQATQLSCLLQGLREPVPHSAVSAAATARASRRPVMRQAIQRLEREQLQSHLPLSRFIDSIRPGKGKRKQREEGGLDDDADDSQPSVRTRTPPEIPGSGCLVLH